MDEEQTSSKKIWFILGGIILLLILGIGIYFFINKSAGGAVGTKSVGGVFGNGGDTTRPVPTDINPGSQTNGNNPNQNGNPTEEPLFRQLANIPVAGATSIVRDGKTYVRYVSRENGNIFEVDPLTGAATQLTNTTVPRIHEAFWGNSGNSVVLRYLAKDQLTKQDTIKTYLANLILPSDLQALNNATSSQVTLGSLKGDFLADNISAVSMSADGTHLFFLLPVADGISGSIVDITTKNTREVLRSSFSEWLPELLNSGMIILTTKASANVSGFSYLYNPLNKTFSRMVREKLGLTTHAEPSGGRMLYGENLSGNPVISLFDAKGFLNNDGDLIHTEPLQLVTLPEKCVWANNRIRLYCGAFSSQRGSEIPDDWYQGVLAFSDTFWTINTDTSEITLLADPSKEKSAMRNFDVFMPFSGGDENHLFFIDKNDATLWSMRIIKDKFITPEETTSASDTPVLTPDEQKDALGSMNIKSASSSMPSNKKK